MVYTYLQLANQVCSELGLPALGTIKNNPNQTARQIGALMNRAGDEIYQNNSWVCSQDYTIINIEAPIETTGDYDPASDLIINIPSTAGIVANQFSVTGSSTSVTSGLQVSTRVLEVVSGTSVRIDMRPLSLQVGADLLFARDTYAVPDDFKWFSNQTFWDRTNHWQLVGPLSPQAYQYLVSGIVPTGPRRRWRQVGVEPINWRIWPPPTASNDYPASLEFEYNSRYWAASVAGVRQQWLTEDDDYPLIDGQAIVLSAKWRWLQTKNMPYAAYQLEANDYVAQLASRDGGAPDLSLARPRSQFYLLSTENVQDGNFPGEGNP